MDTKWKNSADKLLGILKRLAGSKLLMAGLLLEITALLWLGFFVRHSRDLNTMEIWSMGFAIDVVMAPAGYLLLSAALREIYRNWVAENEDFYGEWRLKRRQQQRVLAGCAAPLLIAAYIFFMNQSRGYYFYWNFATGYYLIFNVLLMYGVCQLCINRFMQRKLDEMMDKVHEVNAERLAEAVEIERKSLEKAARSEQLKVDLISNVSHDLKTPLTSMVGYLELLKMELSQKDEPDPVSLDYAEVISDKAEKLKEMIESLFSLAKASSGNFQIRLEPVELNRLIEQIFADMEDQVKQSGLEFVTALTKEDTRLTTDNLHMYRICQNLIENALKYSAKGTRVFVKTFYEKGRQGEPGRRLCLEITNTAGYFMDFDKEDIIERFARGDKARSSEGNGLGLAIVSTYASALGGAFDISIDCDQFRAALSFPERAPAPGAAEPGETAGAAAADRTESEQAG